MSPTPHFEAPTLNRSLARGMDLLRCFRAGADLLGNGELAERTGLSPATVSRLTQTLVKSGFLVHDRSQRAYRLAAPVLSLAHAMRSGSPVLRVAAPLMQACAQRLRVNVGLAVPDRDEMVYLESFRYNLKPSLRSVVSGQRVPVALTSLGRAWLASLPESARKAAIKGLREQHGRGWRAIEREIAQAIEQYASLGHVRASWQPMVWALARPLSALRQEAHILNLSITSAPGQAPDLDLLAFHLMELEGRISEALERL